MDFVVFTNNYGSGFDLDTVDYLSRNGKNHTVLIAPDKGCGCKK